MTSASVCGGRRSASGACGLESGLNRSGIAACVGSGITPTLGARVKKPSRVKAVYAALVACGLACATPALALDVEGHRGARGLAPENTLAAFRTALALGVDTLEPDVQVTNDIPPELKGKDETKGEASLKGHLKNGDDEQGGSSAYVPPDPKNDKQLNFAFDLLRGVKVNDARPAPSGATNPN